MIVTVYNSHNSGSFLQAFALMRVLQQMGHEVAFLKRSVKGSSHDIKCVVKNVCKKLIKFQFKQALCFLKEWFIYEDLQRLLPIVEIDSEYYKTAECVVLGSDTIWNFASKYFYINASRYLGCDFKGKKVITYAASAGNTSQKLFKTVTGQYGNLSCIDTIMVRDQYTKTLVESTSTNKALLVTDPTLLVTKKIYETFKNIIPSSKPYLLLYFFGSIPPILKNELLYYAKKHQLAIVSMPLSRTWCDVSVFSSPKNMVSYFFYAHSVVTDTFHGTAFSMIYEKSYAVYDAGKTKVVELLATYNEKNRLFKDVSKVSDILSINNTVIASGRIESVRNDSLYLFKSALMKSNNGVV